MLERDWPVLPIPLFLFKDVCYELARENWQDTEGMPPFEVRDLGLLLGTLAQPYQRFEGKPLYPSVVAKAACLFRGLVKDHPLVDGNKRVAVTTTGTFLALNGRPLTASNDRLRDYALRVARHHGDYPIHGIERWLRRHSEVLTPIQLEHRRRVNQGLYEHGDPVEEWFAEG